MGIGPVFSIPKLLESAGLTVDDIDLWELNEAFASQEKGWLVPSWPQEYGGIPDRSSRPLIHATVLREFL